MAVDAPVSDGSRLERLLRYLQSDPGNATLLADAAAAAFDARDFDQAAALLGRLAAIGPLAANMVNLAGLVALAQQRFGDAAAILEGLRAGGRDDAALRFNLAWAKAMTGQWQGALDLLSDEAVAASARGPSLKIQMMHHLDMLDEALACGAQLAERYPDNQALMGALATVALDAKNPDIALAYAQRAGEDGEGRAALGILTLGQYDTATSLALFDSALARQPRNPRAWVGKGLGLLAAGDAAAGAEAIDRGAELFREHLGSWIASGWAHFINGDYAKARASFERSLAIDDTFAEAHGGLAVLDIVAGKLDEAKRRCDIALRLDRNCFGGALAKVLLLERSGHSELAQKIREVALNTPIGPNGQTIVQAMAGFGRSPRTQDRTRRANPQSGGTKIS